MTRYILVCSAMACFFTAVTSLRTEPEKGVLLRPGATFDYAKIAIHPEKWKAKKLSTQMTPWEGEHIVFATWAKSDKKLDPKVMSQFVFTLEKGWRVCASLMPKYPQRKATLFGHPYVAALPARVTCGLSCSRQGETGIEVCSFYERDYDEFAKTPKRFRSYYFDAMARNWDVIGARHSLCESGLTQFVSFLCLKRLEVSDPEMPSESLFLRSESAYSKSKLTWFDVFVKGKTLDKDADGKTLPKPVADADAVYTGMMLKMMADHGDEFPKLFYHALVECPGYDKDRLGGQVGQATNWAIAVCAGARQDMSETLLKRWRFPLDDKAKKTLAKIDWTKDDAVLAALKELDR